jgi:hypothetical protein
LVKIETVGARSLPGKSSRSVRHLLLPMWPGLLARRTHDYTRHGTTSLFAALEVASGKLHARCFRHHRHAEFIAFLNSPACRYPGH